MLFARGCLRGGAEEWVESHPEDVKAIHQAYFDAGSDIVLTNTFGGSPVDAQLLGYADKAAAWNQRAAELAPEISQCGSFDQPVQSARPDILPPLGTMTEEEAYNGFKNSGDGYGSRWWRCHLCRNDDSD